MNEPLAGIKAWLAAHAAPLLQLFNPPAGDADIAAFEARTSLVLPPEARRLYALHDGESDASDGLFGCWRWLPLSVSADEVELTGSEGIVPQFRSGGDLLYVKSHDTTASDPRVYEWWHEKPEAAAVVATSLEAFLVGFAADLRAGRFVYRPDELAALIDRREA